MVSRRTVLEGVGSGHNPASNNIEHARKALIKRKQRKRFEEAQETLEDVKAGSTPSKWCLIEGQEVFLDVARRAHRFMKTAEKELDKATRLVKKKKAALTVLEKEQANLPPAEPEVIAERQRLHWHAMAAVEQARAEEKLAEDKYAMLVKLTKEHYKDMATIAEKAAPYFDPKLAAVEQHTTIESTQVNVHVDLQTRLEPYREALRALGNGELGDISPESGRIIRELRQDSPPESLDSTETTPQTSNVPPLPG